MAENTQKVKDRIAQDKCPIRHGHVSLLIPRHLKEKSHEDKVKIGGLWFWMVYKNKRGGWPNFRSGEESNMVDSPVFFSVSPWFKQGVWPLSVFVISHVVYFDCLNEILYNNWYNIHLRTLRNVRLGLFALKLYKTKCGFNICPSTLIQRNMIPID